MKIFMSYRRDDSAGHAGRLHDRLERQFGKELVFMDVDSIPLGLDFVSILKREVETCDVLLAIIGPNWLIAKDRGGTLRLSDPNDFVRIEIAAALRRNIPVVPILLEDAQIPRSDQLPEELKSLAIRNGMNIRHASFHSDVEKLIRGIDQHAGMSKPDNRLIDERDKAQSIAIEVGPRATQKTLSIAPGRTDFFRDLPEAPELVVVPSGEFLMGSPPHEEGREHDGREGPQHGVLIARPFAIGRFAVTVAEFAAFVEGSGYAMPSAMLTLEASGWAVRGNRPYLKPGFEQLATHPVVGVNWTNAKAYCSWLSELIGKRYRLPTETEWEYACRGGSKTPFWWGDTVSTDQANYRGESVYGSGSIGEYRKQTVSVDKFESNCWGLFQVHGNVWEWCEDVYAENYRNAPTDGSACAVGKNPLIRVMRGGSWSNSPRFLRSASRGTDRLDVHDSIVGFRVVREL